MRILIVEDDKGASRFIKKGLTEEGFLVETVFDGEEGLFMATEQEFDLIILDIMLPEMNGYEVIKGIRAKGVSTPVVFLTARDQQAEIIHGFDLGADDYLVKPFAFAELLARIRAVLRRGQKNNDLLKINIDDLFLDRISRSAERGGMPIELSAKEYLLLEYFMINAGQVLTRTMILEHVWGYNFDTCSNVIEVHINRLRTKIDKDFSNKLINTVKGIGYVFKIQD